MAGNDGVTTGRMWIGMPNRFRAPHMKIKLFNRLLRLSYSVHTSIAQGSSWVSGSCVQELGRADGPEGISVVLPGPGWGRQPTPKDPNSGFDLNTNKAAPLRGK